MKNIRLKEIMKPIKLLILILFSFILSCGTSSKQAAEYNDFVVETHTELGLYIDSLMIALNHQDSIIIRKYYDKLLAQSLQSIRDVEQNGVLKSDTSYFESVLSLFQAYNTIVKFEIDTLVYLQSLPPEVYTLERFRRTKSLNDSVKSRILQNFEVFSLEQEKFSKKYQLDLK